MAAVSRLGKIAFGDRPVLRCVVDPGFIGTASCTSSASRRGGGSAGRVAWQAPGSRTTSSDLVFYSMLGGILGGVNVGYGTVLVAGRFWAKDAWYPLRIWEAAVCPSTVALLGANRCFAC